MTPQWTHYREPRRFDPLGAFIPCYFIALAALTAWLICK